MNDLEFWQYALIGLIFLWGGFIRTGIGFGGAIFTLPFLLLIVDDPLLFLPLLGMQVIVFGLFNSYHKHTNIDWHYLKKAIKIMIIPKLIAVYGLLVLPPTLMSLIVFIITFSYAISYIFNLKFKSNSNILDKLFLIIGGYVSGTSLIGAPIIFSVLVRHISKLKLRDSLLALWVILSSIKMLTLAFFKVDFSWMHQLWLFPIALTGHYLGLMIHEKIQQLDTAKFYRLIGFVLLLVTFFGIWQILNKTI